MVNLILVLILAAIVGGAIAYIYKEKKNGAKCIGCPSAKNCGGNCGGSCSGCEHS